MLIHTLWTLQKQDLKRYDWLREHNGYEQETPHAYNKDFALVDKWVERFVTETQPEKVKQSMCFASPSERFKFFTGWQAR
ncbi:MAG: hypothetical protein MJ000_00850 [Bacteroidales bacterium]|nr:hypothetical protein [Bacteroidales bacterium]